MFKQVAKFRETITRVDLLRIGEKVLTALSGGPDSVALFHLLNLIAAEYELTIAAAHVHHGLRKEADSERKFCAELCKAYGCKFYSRKIDIKARAKRLKLGVEQAGRDYRYKYFQSLSEKYGYDKIATGHSADDTAETFLLNLLRGANIGGLGGIPPKRGSIIRPLSDFSKKEILDFLKSNKLSYKIDKSNFGIDYNRNIIRNRILPLMSKINPGALPHIAKSANNIRDSYGLIEETSAKAYEICRVKRSKRQIILDLGKLPVYYESLKSWVLLRAYFDLTGASFRPDSAKIERVLALSRSGSQAFLDNDVIAVFYDDKLVLSRPSRRLTRIKLEVNKFNRLPDGRRSIRLDVLETFDVKRIRANRDENIAFVDGAKIDRLEARGLKTGDKFRPLGLEGTKKLVDYLNDKKICQKDKQTVPIVVSGEKIVWVAGCGISDEFKVTESTTRILKLELIDGEAAYESTDIGR